MFIHLNVKYWWYAQCNLNAIELIEKRTVGFCVKEQHLYF